MLRDHRIGIPCLAGDPESLVDALSFLGADAALRHRMGRSSYDAALRYNQYIQYGRFADFLDRHAEDVVRGSARAGERGRERVGA